MVRAHPIRPMLRCLRSAATILLFSAAAASLARADIVLSERGYFEKRGLNVLVFSNVYDGLFSDAKIAGVELIHHGQRTATNGDVRLAPTPGQWDAAPQLVERKVDAAAGVITAHLRYPDHAFDFIVRAEARGDAVVLSVELPKPVPAALVGRAGFNLEFLPSAYFRRTFLMDHHSGNLPLYPASAMTRGSDNALEPLPLATGKSLVLAPEDQQRRVQLVSSSGEISLYDGRNQAQNGWFVARTLLPADRTGRVVEWTLTASTVSDWTRPPVIGRSQVGYHPADRKVAVIELDRHDQPAESVRLLRVEPSGKFTEALAGPAKRWGAYLRYEYATFDFSAVREPGVYVIEYRGTRSAAFRIAADAYADIWHASNDVYLPVQMDHMFVNEAHRVWHGDPHRDDARQAPVNHEHFDLYAQGPETDTRFQPGEHIPGLNIGGWLDAGDFDIRTQTNYHVVQQLVHAWERFRPTRDQTTIDQSRRFVDIHVPDGTPDILQQIEHGTLQLLAQHRAVGHAIAGIVEPDLGQYTHLGDAASKTDGLIYDPSLAPGQSDGFRSGTPDDRWAFTTETSALNFGSTAALAAASRALRGYRDDLAEECLATARSVWEREHSRPPKLFRHGNTTGGIVEDEEFRAAVELLLATREAAYSERARALWPTVRARTDANLPHAIRALPLLGADFRAELADAARAFSEQVADLRKQNPYGVPIHTGGWAGSTQVMRFANAAYLLHREFPEIVNDEAAFDGLHYILGRHPGSELSLVSGVGTQTKEVAYGSNRADFSFIAGGVVPGVLILKPDFPENKEDWPFLWGENEYVVNGGADFMFLAHAAHDLATRRK